MSSHHPSNSTIRGEIERVEQADLTGDDEAIRLDVLDQARRALALNPKDATQRRWRKFAYEELIRFRHGHDL